MSLVELLCSSNEILQSVVGYLDASSALDLTKVCSSMYIGLPRNSPLGVQIWRTLLVDPRYNSNKLTLETSRLLATSDKISRANYKCILAVLTQKNGFMKVSRLKSLCAAGKLSTPVLPRHGGWRALVRLDQFALRRASKESISSDQSGIRISTEDTPVDVKFVARMAGQKGKRALLEQRFETALQGRDEHECLKRLVAIYTILMTESNIAGMSEILEVSEKFVTNKILESVLESTLQQFSTQIEDNILHVVMKDSRLQTVQKLHFIKLLLAYNSIKKLLNKVNLHHETPLVLINKISVGNTPDLAELQKIADLMISAGADQYLCDRKGLFYQPVWTSGA